MPKLEEGTAVFDGIPCRLKVHELGPCKIELWEVEDPNRLLDQMSDADFGEEEKMPYWAAVWPASLFLARQMAPLPLENKQVLELGCGLGLNGVMLAKLGAKVTMTDWYHEAVRMALRNAEQNGVQVEAAWMDWNKVDLNPSFDLLLGSDILYETRNHAPVLRAAGSLLKPQGELWLSDPGRAHLPDFVALALQSGWVVEERREGKLVVLRLHRGDETGV